MRLLFIHDRFALRAENGRGSRFRSRLGGGHRCGFGRGFRRRFGRGFRCRFRSRYGGGFRCGCRHALSFAMFTVRNAVATKLTIIMIGRRFGVSRIFFTVHATIKFPM